MPWTSDGIVHHQTFGQRGPIMGAGRADGEEGVGALSHQYGLAPGVALQHAAVAKLGDRDPLREVRSAQFLFFCHLFRPSRRLKIRFAWVPLRSAHPVGPDAASSAARAVLRKPFASPGGSASCASCSPLDALVS